MVVVVVCLSLKVGSVFQAPGDNVFNSDDAKDKLDMLVANALNEKEFLDMFKDFEVSEFI